ncbi:hypothetical protein HPB50_003101 [Hyalomma asiaticum]|uniref:Uncharacterized protein n=1 Tax=Hyalomma asiaticum TaxID=266040 RepID=A0ACB7RJY5_HYAAI|nr:hypothetical protein HPB50_003101 [Hyalomma asiaticum]
MPPRKGRPHVLRTPEEQLAYEARRLELRRQYHRRRRAATSAEDRARAADRKRQLRRDEARREWENAAKRRKSHAARLYYRGVLLRRCPCGQVSSSCTSSQASGWVVRREVSTQCGLKEMPPLPLPLDICEYHAVWDLHRLVNSDGEM